MAMKSRADVLKAYENGINNGASNWLNGVKRQTVSPTAKAGDNPQKYLQGVQKAVADGTYADACKAVTLADYTSACTEKQANYANASKRAAAKYAKDLDDRMRFQEQIQQGLAAMPTNTEAEREQRMLYQVREMRKYKKQR